MSKTIKDLSILASVTIISTLLIWLPHLLNVNNFLGLNYSNGFATIYRNFDGLEYVVIAKTFYNSQLIASMPNTLPANYYAAHFIGYSLVILFLAPILGFLKSMLFTSLIFTVLSAFAFYFLVRDFKLSNHPLWLSVVFLALPARWLIVRSVGSAEPMFIFFVISSVYFFMKYELGKRYLFLLLAVLLAIGTQITRPPGILLFIAFGLYVFWKILRELRQKNITQVLITNLKFTPLILVPISLLCIFYFYGIVYKDFLAYFHSGDNIHLTFPPFSVFNKNQFWVGDIWLEDIIFIFILGFLGGLTLLRKKLYIMAFFVLVYLSASSLVAHRDISRYALPIFPFLLIAFERVLISKEFKIVLAVLSLGIYLYAQNFIIQNVAPVENLSTYN